MMKTLELATQADKLRSQVHQDHEAWVRQAGIRFSPSSYTYRKACKDGDEDTISFAICNLWLCPTRVIIVRYQTDSAIASLMNKSESKVFGRYQDKDVVSALEGLKSKLPLAFLNGGDN